jgi:hypothetical protein
VKNLEEFLKSWQSKLGWQARLQLFSATTTRNVTSTEPTAVTGASYRTTWSQTNRRVYSQTHHDTADAEHRTERLAAEPVSQRDLSHANYRSRPQEQNGRGRRTKVYHRSSVYALQRATHRPEPEHQHHLRPSTRLQHPKERRTSACTTTRSMDQKVTYERSYGPHCNSHPANQAIPASRQWIPEVCALRAHSR